MRERIKQVSQFVHDYLMETGKDHEDEPWGPKYRWEHTLRVAHWAWILAREEKADIEKNVIAALFHDVSHFVSKDYRKHGEKSAEIAMNFMLKAGFPKDYAEDASYAVKSHVGERNPKTVQDLPVLGRVETPEMLLEFTMLRVVNNHATSCLSGLPVETEFRVKNKLGVPINCSAYVFITTARGTIYPDLSANQTLFSVAQNQTVFRRLHFNLPFKNENYVLHVKVSYIYLGEVKELSISAAFRTSIGTALIEILFVVLAIVCVVGFVKSKSKSGLT